MPRDAVSHTSEYIGLLIDVDGVVLNGGQILLPAKEALDLFGSRRVPVVFITNNVTRPREETEELLREAAGSETICLIDPFDVLVQKKELHDVNFLLLGSDQQVRRLRDLGIAATATSCTRSDITGVLITSVVALDYSLLIEASRHLKGNIPGWATGLDRTFQWRGVHWPGVGAIVAFLEHCSRAKVNLLGKPGPDIFRLGRSRIGGDGEVLVVGDDLSMDVFGAMDAGFAAALVLSGITQANECAESHRQPEFIGADLNEIATFVLRR